MDAISEKQNLKHILYLASLFHDIGKFRQRGKMSDVLKNGIKDEYKFQISENKSGLAHQYVGAYVYSKSKLPYRDTVSAIISRHHEQLSNLNSEPDVLVKIVSLADKLSASERENYTAQPNDKIKFMRSIISSVSLNNVEKVKFYKKVSKFSEALEPVEQAAAKQISVEDVYEKLWSEFEKFISDGELESRWGKENDHDVLGRIYYLLKEYTSNIPSAFYYNEPDISLFSHSTTTAAIAVALYKQFENELFEKQNDRFVKAAEILNKKESFSRKYRENKTSQADPEDEEIFGVIKGDISGIQDFIYKTSWRNGLKKLRARSFFIAYLSEIIARYIIDKEGLYQSNILYCGGGHFYLLVPAKTIDKLEEYQKDIEEKMYKAFGLDLAVLLGGIKINIYDLIEFKVHDKLARILEEKKNKKFENVIDLEMFIPEDFSGPRCPYCGRKMLQVTRKEEEQEEAFECVFCESFAELGRKLATSEYLKIEKCPELITPPVNVYEVFKMFGYELKFSDNPDKFAFAIDKATYDQNKAMYFTKMASYVYKKAGKYYETPADLETIAQEAEGLKRWGLLRGDVDNLGRIFQTLQVSDKEKRTPISFVSTLSSELESFFSIVIERIVAERHEKCNVIYSGGDDFMILGPWSELPLLAKDITNEFRKYSKNDELSISMAIAVAPSRKFPVYKLGTLAGEYLDDKAKSYKRTCNNKELEKSAIYMFGGCVGWEEFDKVEAFKNDLESLINKNVTKNIFYILTRLIEKQERNEPTRIWRLYYYIARLEERHNAETKKEIHELFNKILVNKNMIHPKLKISIKWLHDKLRKTEERKIKEPTI
ncbi:type III-A CRISPR-associated protein Cas10/Csm1 [Fervidobacterium gondwanense]|uniref:type III-A CRISPR-associated protein Cas10/Csm1 n=1 Tax=Fervidobacterium gondwanense TaxID=44754 RepID=UPI003C76B88E